MINVDGVARGNYRFSAAGVDLNRKWKQPNEHHHPEVYQLKEMILR
jgi:murein tripeptide amidase MpaA